MGEEERGPGRRVHLRRLGHCSKGRRPARFAILQPVPRTNDAFSRCRYIHAIRYEADVSLKELCILDIKPSSPRERAMSCPNPKPGVPLAQRGLDLDGNERLPWSFYVLTVAMVLGVVGLPILYRKVWVFVAGLIADVKKDISPQPPPAGCRRLGKPAARNLSTKPFELQRTQQQSPASGLRGPRRRLSFARLPRGSPGGKANRLRRGPLCLSH